MSESEGMDSQNSPSVIPCSEEILSEDPNTEAIQVESLPTAPSDSEPNSEPFKLPKNTVRKGSDIQTQDKDENLITTIPDSQQNSEALSQSLLADPCNQHLFSNSMSLNVTSNASLLSSTRINDSLRMDSSTMDLENSVSNRPEESTIKDSSMSILNEGFMFDSASLSILAANESSNNTESREITNSEQQEEELEEEGTEMEVEEDDDVEIQEEDSTTTTTAKKRGRGRPKGGSNEKTKTRRPSGQDEIEIEDSDEEQDENDDEDGYPVPKFPLNRIKKIMNICLATTEEEVVPVQNKNDKDKSKGKGKGNWVIKKEAAYLLTLATECFITLIGERAGTVTLSNKKKTLTFEHLKQALSDTEAFAFLEGCFQPSVIRGD